MISKEDALELVKRTSKYSHALKVSTILRKFAEILGEDKEKWEIVGLLHDIDYDQVENNMSKHGIVAVEILRDKLPQDCLHAIKSHDHRTGFKPESKIDSALIVADMLENAIEKVKEALTVDRVEQEIKKVRKTQPRLEENLRRTEGLGLKISEAIQIARKYVQQ